MGTEELIREQGIPYFLASELLEKGSDTCGECGEGLTMHEGKVCYLRVNDNGSGGLEDITEGNPPWITGAVLRLCEKFYVTKAFTPGLVKAIIGIVTLKLHDRGAVRERARQRATHQ